MLIMYIYTSGSQTVVGRALGGLRESSLGTPWLRRHICIIKIQILLYYYTRMLIIIVTLFTLNHYHNFL